MKYDVEADWLFLRTCNFRCGYCFLGADGLGSKAKAFGTPLEWKQGFDATGKTWLLHLTGGEPGLYPDFVDLCEQLTQTHYLSLNSNLTHRSIQEFARRIDPSRVSFINAAVHWEERERKTLRDVFFENVDILKGARFPVFLSLVMTPHVLGHYKDVIQRFEERDLFVIPKVLRGVFGGRRYPAAYSRGQKALIGTLLAEARDNYRSVLSQMDEPPSIDVFSDGRFLGGVKNYRGRICEAGSRFVVVRPNGTVVLCRTDGDLGNILSRTVALDDGPRVCNTSYCPYFCEKYSRVGSRLSVYTRRVAQNLSKLRKKLAI